MENLAELNIINQMLEVERRASQTIEDAKREAGVLIDKARKESKGYIDVTKEEIVKKSRDLERQFEDEARHEVERIKADKETALKILKRQSNFKKEFAVKRLRKFLLENFLDGLC